MLGAMRFGLKHCTKRGSPKWQLHVKFLTLRIGQPESRGTSMPRMGKAQSPTMLCHCLINDRVWELDSFDDRNGTPDDPNAGS